MDIFQIILGVWAAIMSGLSIWLKIQSNKQQKNTIALQKALDEIKRFDEHTAMNLLLQARDLDHSSWELQELIKDYVHSVQPTNTQIDIVRVNMVSCSSAVHARAFSNMKSMTRIYQLAGAPITIEKINKWVNEGFIPPQYRSWLLPQASSND